MKRYLFVFILCPCMAMVLAPIEKISADLEVKRVYKGKLLTSKGAVYYESARGHMVTRFTLPQEQIVISTASGEFKNYDVKHNTVGLSQGADYSSKNSFIHFCLTGKTLDMGLPALGFVQKSSKIEDGLLVTSWVHKSTEQSPISRVELVHEANLPIYMGFYNTQQRLFSKIYYSKYTKVQGISFPQTITEIEYLAATDSVVTKKTYTNYRTNGEVDATYLNFKIPANAKAIKLDKEF